MIYCSETEITVLNGFQLQHCFLICCTSSIYGIGQLFSFFYKITLRDVQTVVHEAILHRTFISVRSSQRRTRTKVRVSTSTTSSNSVGFFVRHTRVRHKKYALALFRLAYCRPFI